MCHRNLSQARAKRGYQFVFAVCDLAEKIVEYASKAFSYSVPGLSALLLLWCCFLCVVGHTGRFCVSLVMALLIVTYSTFIAEPAS